MRGQQRHVKGVCMRFGWRPGWFEFDGFGFEVSCGRSIIHLMATARRGVLAAAVPAAMMMATATACCCSSCCSSLRWWWWRHGCMDCGWSCCVVSATYHIMLIDEHTSYTRAEEVRYEQAQGFQAYKRRTQSDCTHQSLLIARMCCLYACPVLCRVNKQARQEAGKQSLTKPAKDLTPHPRPS